MMTTTDVRMPTTVKPTSQQVVVVSKQSQLNGLLETVLDAGPIRHCVRRIDRTRLQPYQAVDTASDYRVPRYRRSRRVPGFVDAEARRRDERHSAGDLHVVAGR